MCWKNFACVLLASTLVFGAVGCGSQSGIVGYGSFAVTSVAPNPVPGMIPTAVTITGGDWSNVIGTQVEVKWVAPAGTIPFLGGTSNQTTSIGTITSATTIATVTPRAVICGPASLDVIVNITMPSGVWGSSVVPIITFLAPTMTSISGGGIFPAAIPTPFTITGTGYGDIGSPVTIHWRSTDAVVPTPFDAGSSPTIETHGVVTSATTITGTSPLALVCGPATSSAEIYEIYFQDGSCTPTANPPLPITFVAPTITAIVNNTTRALDAGTSQFAAAIPDEPFTITGTGYGPVGGAAQVTFTSTAATAIWNNGTSTSVTVQGTIVNSTTITGDSPPALMCAPGLASDAQNVTVVMPDGSCTPAPTAATVFAPQFDAATPIVNNTAGSPFLGANDFAAALPEEFLITGTRFGQAGTSAMVTFTSANPFFQAGTSLTTTVLGSITSSTTIIGTSPASAICGAPPAPGAQVSGPASDTAAVLVTCEGGSCTPTTVAADFFPPVITGPNTNLTGRPLIFGFSGFFNHIPEAMQITGTNFGPIGGSAFVTFLTGLPGQTPYTPAGGGANVAISQPVLATITSRTTMELISPEGNLVTSAPGGGNLFIAGGCTGTVDTPTIAAQFEGGSCTPTPFADPFQFMSVINGPGVVSPLTVVSTIPLGQTTMPTFTQNGMGFWPIGGQATITFLNGVPAGTFNGAATISVTGTIVNETTITATLPLIDTPRLTADETADSRVTLQGGTDAQCTASHVFSAPPTITTITNADAGAAAPSLLATVPGTDYIPGHNSTMSIVGTGFDLAGGPSETAITIYDLNSGVGAAPTLTPVRRLGTATPVGNDLGDAALYTTNLTAATISARIRLERSLDDLDTNRDGLVTARVRLLNADGQFDESGGAAADPVYRTTSPATNVGSGLGSDQINTSVAIDPTSFTDDFSVATGANDLVTPGVNMAVAASLDDPGIGFGVFLATDAVLSTSQDGGGTWTTGAVGLAGIEGAPLPAAVGDETRNYFHVKYDTFGTLWLCYLRTAPTVGQDDLILINSTNNGASWTFAPGVIASTGALAPFGAGLLSAPHMETGSIASLLNELVVVTWVDRTATLGPGFSDVVRAFVNAPLGPGSINVFGTSNVSDPAVAPPAFFLLDPKVAIGPSGEIYVAWQEPNALFTAITFRVDCDRDGPGSSFVYNAGADVAITSTPVLAVGLPSQPDITFLPSIDLAVAQAGSNSGRAVFAYDRIIPSAGVGTRDHAQILTHVSDTFGATWSSGAAPHPLDQSDRYMPAITSDFATGRMHVSWYDTTPSGGVLGANTTFDRRASASEDGVSWGAARSLFSGRTPTAHALNGNNDHGLFVDIVAFRGCVLAGWGDPADTAGATNDPVVTVYQQNDK